MPEAKAERGMNRLLTKRDWQRLDMGAIRSLEAYLKAKQKTGGKARAKDKENRREP